MKKEEKFVVLQSSNYDDPYSTPMIVTPEMSWQESQEYIKSRAGFDGYFFEAMSQEKAEAIKEEFVRRNNLWYGKHDD